MNHPLFEIVRTSTGAISIRNKIVNEIMHNPVGPWIESNALYIDQSGLRTRLLEATDEELVLFDVGLGAAANALAVLHCVAQLQQLHQTQFDLGLPKPRKLRLISFERDLTLLEFALANSTQFEHFRGYEGAIAELLATGRWANDFVTWELRHGDFLSLITNETRRAEIVFFDPYSPQVNREMWTVSCFKLLKEKCREQKDGGAILFTYSQATPIRAALLVAGFYVGSGDATGLKEETTQAATGRNELKRLLNERWFQRWAKSHTPYPLGTEEHQRAEVQSAITNHPQFKLTAIGPTL